MYHFDFISVGIDVGSKVSWASIITPDHKQVFKPIRIDHGSMESLEFFIQKMKEAEEMYSMKTDIFMESTGIYHIPLYCYLKEFGFSTYILNPLITDSNKNQGIRKVKSDKTDAKRIAKTAYTDGLKVSLIPSTLALNLRNLTRAYHKLVDEKTIHVNQLSKELAIIFPGYTELFSNTLGKTSKSILHDYMTPNKVLGAPKEELISLIKTTSKRGIKFAEDKTAKLIETAKVASVFSLQLESSEYMVELQLSIIEVLDKKIKDIIEKLHTYMKEFEKTTIVKQVKLIRSITGVGFITSITLIAEIGDFSEFSSPKQLVAYFGLDPSVKESGKFKGSQNRMSKRGSSVARRVLFIIVIAAIRTTKNGRSINEVLKTYYDKKLESKAKKVALGIMMRKMTNIIFAVLRDEKEYEMRTPEEHSSNYQKEHLSLVA